MARRMFKGNTVATNLAGPITNSALTFTVTTNGGTTYPDGSTGNFVVTLDYGATTGEEKVLCSARAGDVFTVAPSGRGYDNTAAGAHSAGAAVRHTISAVDLDEANAHLFDTTRDDHTQYAKRGQGLAANVGAASRAGRFFIATDSEDLYADDGTAVHRYLSKAATDAAYLTPAAANAAYAPLSGSANYVAKTDPTTATVATQESTSSATYADLATVGPAATVTIGASGRALVLFGADAQISSAGAGAALAQFAISGASTVAASDTDALKAFAAGTTAIAVGATQARLVTGLAAGSTTFTMKYRSTAGTSFFTTRRITVIPL